MSDFCVSTFLYSVMHSRSKPMSCTGDNLKLWLQDPLVLSSVRIASLASSTQVIVDSTI